MGSWRGMTFKNKVTPVGSRVICPSACSTDSDWDYLTLVHDLGSVVGELVDAGWTIDDHDRYATTKDSFTKTFTSLRKADGDSMLNLILTNNREFHGQFLLATEVAKKLGLTSKKDRVILFQAVLYGNVE